MTVAFVSAGAGFLLAVLWFDLMFDVQVARSVDAEKVDSIARYYRRVTTDARPMNRLIAFAMVGTLAGVVYELARSIGPAWARWLSLALVLAPVAVAGSMTVKRAVRLGAQTDEPKEQAMLAQTIFREHVFCLVCIGGLLAMQLLALTS
jgi:uncharacterized membrane protein YfcA